MTAESTVLASVRFALNRRADCRVHRNNVGALQDKTGRWVQYGLAVGSSDLIGWTVRNGVAVFTSIEVKAARGRLTPEQANWLRVVQDAGGVAGMVRSADEAVALVEGGV